jgi:ABC-type uncharacterized transport system auxiliary subunit
MMKRIKTLAICILAVVTVPFLVLGCMGRRHVEKDTFVLDVSRSAAGSLSGSDAVLRVRTLRVSPRYEGKGFVYRTGDLSYKSDYYNQFFAQPDAMITEEVREWLERSGLFRQVLDYTAQVEHTHILEGEVLDLYGDFSRGIQPKASLGMEFFFLEDVSGRSRAIFQKRYRKEVPLKGDSAEALVKGWNEALANILTDLERDLRETAFKAGQ